MNNSQLAIETILPQQLVHAMLGLRYWLPRNRAISVANTSIVLPVCQDESNGWSNDTVSVSRHMLYGKYSSGAVHDQEDLESSKNTHPIVEKITIASGVELTSHGTMVFDQIMPYAWFFPLPWRHKQGWCQWRNPSEGKLLEEACNTIGLDGYLALLRTYQQQKMGFLQLPDEDFSLFSIVLPSSIKEIITFSGLTWQNITGGSQSEDSVIIDWHGREVRVRCLPHPYCCLLEPSNKRVLWQRLIKLKYEM